MFTSRAEHRLLLRIDNADLRLTPRGREAGLVDDDRWETFLSRRGRYERNLAVLDGTLVRLASGDRASASQALRQPEVSVDDLAKGGQVALELTDSGGGVDAASLETTIKYAGYLKRQQAEVVRLKRDESRSIPDGFKFDGVPGLSREIVQRLSEVRPDTLGHALRVPGVTPAAVAVLAASITRLRTHV
jgi:tRNA uridine 5-carboxymethylaminomethyl modification enzyme